MKEIKYEDKARLNTFEKRQVTTAISFLMFII